MLGDRTSCSNVVRTIWSALAIGTMRALSQAERRLSARELPISRCYDMIAIASPSSAARADSPAGS